MDTPPTQELLVYGYVRDIERELKSEWIVPKSINAICLKFYLDEIFEKVGKYMQLSNDNKSVSYDKKDGSQGHQSAYGSVVISPKKASSNVIMWTIRIDRRASADGVAIGIDQAIAKNINQDFPYRKDTVHYSYCSWKNKGKIYSTSSGQITEIDGMGYGVGDYITMIFDVKEKSLIFLNNGKETGIEFNNIDTNKNYRLAVSLKGYGVSKVTIVDFEFLQKGNTDLKSLILSESFLTKIKRWIE